MPVNRRPRLVGISLVLALVMAGSGALTGPVAAASDVHLSLRPWLGLAASAARFLPGLTGALQAIVGPSSIDYGSDGRLTILVVGSDYRPGHGGERLDAVMVATVNPVTHQMAAVSIPRDTGMLPLPDPNDTWKGKVNSMYAHYKRIGLGTREDALDRMREAIAYALDIEIDYVAFARFTGFDFLVDQLGTVPVDIPLEIRDKRIWDSSGLAPGALFLAGNDVELGGESAAKCHATPKPINWANVPPCYHALPYVRSRHGLVGTKNNNNYKRDLRQQHFLMAAVARVVAMVTADSTSLNTLRDAALTRMADFNDFYTTLPISDDADLLALFVLFNGAQDQPFLQVTLKPRKYAYHVPGTRKYALKLDAVRALTHEWFAPVE